MFEDKSIRVLLLSPLRSVYFNARGFILHSKRFLVLSCNTKNDTVSGYDSGHEGFG